MIGTVWHKCNGSMLSEWVKCQDKLSTRLNAVRLDALFIILSGGAKRDCGWHSISKWMLDRGVMTSEFILCCLAPVRPTSLSKPRQLIPPEQSPITTLMNSRLENSHYKSLTQSPLFPLLFQTKLNTAPSHVKGPK